MQKLDVQQTEQKLLQGYRIIDVRAPVEFAQGALPNSVNLPLLIDQERALIGTCYKNKGRESAISLGHQLVSGENKELKLKSWKTYFEAHPDSLLTCFRGGLRSQTTQQFLKEIGIEIPRVAEGYKAMRQHFADELAAYSVTKTARVLTGNTGSGKTRLLWEIKKLYPVVDLEDLAQHRGSAFGRLHGRPQPAQATFESTLAFEVLKYERQKARPILFEDESRLIGSLHLPEIFFAKLRESKVIKLKVPIEKRIENIFQDYILIDELKDPALIDVIYDKYTGAIGRISKKLGGLRAAELLSDMAHSRAQLKDQAELKSNKIWIEKLLLWYYDPMYVYSLTTRNPEIEFEGTELEVISFLQTQS